MLKKLERLRLRIQNFRPLDEDLLQTVQEVLRIDWTYNSNALEGNTLTYGETAFFLREGLTSEGKPLKDYLEAKNHAEAIDYLHEIVQGRRKLTEGLIKELHALLLKDVEFTRAKGAGGQMVKKPLYPGKYKTRPNHVLTFAGKIHYYTDPLHVHDEMEKLLSWFHGYNRIHCVEKAAIFHYRFVAIHPFDDGNGRLARLLMNLILMKEGYFPCIIKNEYRKRYLESLAVADEGLGYNDFVTFVAMELIETEEKILSLIEGKGNLRMDAGKQVLMNRDERQALIVSKLSGASLSVSQILLKLPQIKRPTLKKDLQELVKNGKIKRKGVGKGAIYGDLYP
ncbi:Fic family protein [Candidatus Peregrinibacteria bacterium]|nr:Fic family protein [Candidatus Peregrinibacteria bacterium]